MGAQALYFWAVICSMLSIFTPMSRKIYSLSTVFCSVAPSYPGGGSWIVVHCETFIFMKVTLKEDIVPSHCETGWLLLCPNADLGVCKCKRSAVFLFKGGRLYFNWASLVFQRYICAPKKTQTSLLCHLRSTPFSFSGHRNAITV